MVRGRFSLFCWNTKRRIICLEFARRSVLQLHFYPCVIVKFCEPSLCRTTLPDPRLVSVCTSLLSFSCIYDLRRVKTWRIKELSKTKYGECEKFFCKSRCVLHSKGNWLTHRGFSRSETFKTVIEFSKDENSSRYSTNSPSELKTSKINKLISIS